jgi:hypothetical protein
VGPHSVVVTVDGKGNAEGSVEFTYTASISSLAPTSGSLGGKKAALLGHDFTYIQTCVIQMNICHSSEKVLGAYIRHYLKDVYLIHHRIRVNL